MEGVRRSSVPSCLTNSRSVWIGATVQGTLRSHSTLNSTRKAGLEYVFVLQLTSLLREVVFGFSGLSAKNVSEGTTTKLAVTTSERGLGMHLPTCPPATASQAERWLVGTGKNWTFKKTSELRQPDHHLRDPQWLWKETVVCPFLYVRKRCSARFWNWNFYTKREVKPLFASQRMTSTFKGVQGKGKIGIHFRKLHLLSTHERWKCENSPFHRWNVKINDGGVFYYFD